MAATKLHAADGRRDASQVLIEGRHLVGEALDARLQLLALFTTESSDLTDRAGAAGVEVVTVSDRVLTKLATTQHPAGPIAIAATPTLASRTERSCVVAWGIGDPGNLGTLIRSCAAFGVPAVVGPGCVDVWSPKVLRAAAGAHFRPALIHAPDLTVAELAGWGLSTWAAVPDGGVTDVDPDAVAVLIGAEGPGLDPATIAACDGLLTIPMPGEMESLNAGVTGSIVAYQLSPQVGT